MKQIGIGEYSREADQICKHAAELEILDVNIETKKELWIKAGQVFEAEGTPKDKVSTKLRNRIEYHMREESKDPSARFANGYFQRVMSKKGWTDQSRTTDSAKAKQDVTLRSHQDNSYIPDDDDDYPVDIIGDDEVPDGPHPNQEFLDVLAFCIENYRFVYKAIKRERKSIADAIPRKERKALMAYLSLDSIFVKDSANDKQRVPADSYTDFRNLYLQKSHMNAIAKALMYRRIATLDETGEKWMTQKQAKVYLEYRNKNLPSIWMPKTWYTATYKGFHGMPCKECNGYRLVPIPDNHKEAECIDCGVKQPVTERLACNYCQAPFQPDDLKYIEKNHKCKHCDSKITFKVPAWLKREKDP